MMQQSRGRDEVTCALVTGNAPQVTQRSVFQREQVLFQVLYFDKLPLAYVAAVYVFGIENPLQIDGSTVLYHNVSVQGGLVTKTLLA